MVATLHAGLKARFDTLRHELGEADELSKGRVHRLRVATRRLLTALELVGAAAPPGAPKSAHRLEKLLKGLSKLRDLDVLLDGASPLVAEHEDLRAALDELGGERERLARRAARRIERFALDALEGDVTTTLSELDGGRQGTSESTARAAVVRAMATRYLDIERRRQAIRADNRKSLHRLRLSLKGYRYATELLEPLLGATGKREITLLKGLQDRLGALRDQETLAALVRGRARVKGVAPELAALGDALLTEQQRSAESCALALTSGAANWLF